MTKQRAQRKTTGGDEVRTSVAAARTALASRYDKDDHWSAGGRASHAWSQAITLLTRHLLNPADPRRRTPTRDLLAGQQNADGGFPRRTGGPSDLACTVLTHLALRLTGDDQGSEHLDQAARFIRRRGGIDAVPPGPARLWLACAGAISWDRTPPMPPEALLLPPWTPDTADSASPGARALAAAAGILSAARPVWDLPVTTTALHTTPEDPSTTSRAKATAQRAASRAVNGLTPAGVRRRALGAAEDLLLTAQQRDGSWGDDPSATGLGVLALWTLGHTDRHPAVRAALDALDTRSGTPGTGSGGDGGTAADTALVLRALIVAGDRPGASPETDRAIRQLLPQHDGSAGDPPSPLVPDVHGTALLLTAFHLADVPRSPETDAAVAGSVRWLLRRQSTTGGWSRPGIRGQRLLGRTALNALDCDASPAPQVTAHVIQALCAAGYRWHPAVRRAQGQLLAAQAIEGYWEDPGGGRLSSTALILPALGAAGVSAGHLAVEGAMEWLYQQQNPDGGWGDDIPANPGTGPRRGPSTVAHTARCVIAAYSTTLLDRPRLAAAVAFLLRHQTADGGWYDPTAHQPAAHPPGEGTEPPRADISTEAYALWALALHARHLAATGDSATPDPVAAAAAGGTAPGSASAAPSAAGTPVAPAEYDTWSSLWWQRRGPLAILHWGASVRGRHVPPADRPGAVLLDVACGGGLLHPHIKDKGYRHIGVDESTKSAEVARRHGVDDVIIGDIHNIPLPDGYADVVVAGYCLEHVERPFDVVAECIRVLRPGGTLVMDTISPTFLARLSVITLGEGLPLSWAAPKGTHDHRFFISPQRLVDACADNGVPVRPFGVLPYFRDVLSWSVGRSYDVRMRSGDFTKILYGVVGVKPR